MSANWHKDPLNRAEYRWFDGSAWTLRVANGGVESMEPEGTSMSAPASTPPATQTSSFESPSYGQSPAAEPAYGQQPYAQQAYPQPAYGQPAYGQPVASNGGKGRLLAAGVLSIISGVVWLFFAIAVLSVLSSDAGGFVDDVFGGAVTILFLFLLLLGLGFIAAGWGACAGKSWGQIAVITLGIIGVLFWMYALFTDGGAGTLVPILWFGTHVGLAVSAKPSTFGIQQH